MTALQSLLLGILQGLTEFLPISSDGHLTLLEHLLQTTLTGRDFLGFTVVLHAGSLIALLVCYQATWRRLLLSLLPGGDPAARRLMVMIIIATIPGVIAGLLLEDILASMFRDLFWLGVFWLITAGLLVIGERQAAAQKTELQDAGRLSPGQSFLIGLSQAAALLPSLSRSGTTISVGRLVGLSRKEALDFSFLMATPILGGAVLLVALQCLKGSVLLPTLPVTTIGFTSSLVTSLASVLWLRRLVAKYPLTVFNWYLVPLGIIAIIWGLWV
jgi:undecaprenyl-diphosphatase